MFGRLLQELKRRRVLRAAAAYALLGFAVVEGADVMVPNLGLSQAWVRAAAWSVLAGFPVAMFLAWRYDFRFGGFERTLARPEAPPEPENRGAARAGAGPTEAPRAAGTSVAVLPFADMSSEQDQAYFCDGVAEEILDALARVDGLRVAARTSGFAYKGTNKDARAIGRELGVDTVLGGSVRKSGERLRIAAELVRADDGYRFWSETYDRDLVDVFTVQEDIANSVVEHLRSALGFEGDLPRIREHTSDPRAYELYLEGRYSWARRHQVGFQKAIGCFEQALELDPTYALAHTGLADAFSLLGFYRMMDARSARDLIRRSVGLALQHAPELPAALRSLGHMQIWWECDWEAGLRSLERAVELGPRDPETRMFYAQALMAMGRYDEARVETMSGWEMDPESVPIITLVASNSTINRDLERAVEFADRALAREPGQVLVLYVKGITDIALGRHEHAAEQLLLAAEMSRRNPAVLGLLGEAYALAGRREEALAVVAELSALADGLRPEAQLAIVHMCLGDPDAAEEAMERSLSVKEPGLLMIGRSLFTDPLRLHPKYDSWLGRIGLSKRELPDGGWAA